jgi:hypothetical protein
MRRRKVRTIREEERPTLLLMAAGAVAGAAAGLYLGRRYRSMDAFLEDVRDRFGSLRDIWNAADLQPTRRTRLHVDVDDEIDDEDLDDEDDSLEEVDEEELDDEAFATSEAYEDSDAEEPDDDDDDELEDDDFDDELAAVARDNGSSESLRRAEDIARRLEERVLDALHDEPVLSSRSIEIAVVGDGVVELTGTVHSIEEISRAAALVRAIPGVSMVLNRIEVRMGGSIDTASVARDTASE